MPFSTAWHGWGWTTTKDHISSPNGSPGIARLPRTCWPMAALIIAIALLRNWRLCGPNRSHEVKTHVTMAGAASEVNRAMELNQWCDSKTHGEGVVIVDDMVRGPVEFDNSGLDDLIIMRADGTPTYHFGVVIDDSDSKITHVIRGDDHLNNTPRQINIIEALGLTRPQYAHVPMILGEDGTRLSKRHGAVNVLEYREQGYLADALLNYLVRLGWSHGDQEIFSREEMIRLFDIKDVNPSAREVQS